MAVEEYEGAEEVGHEARPRRLDPRGGGRVDLQYASQLRRGRAVLAPAPQQLRAVQPRAQEGRVAPEQVVVGLPLALGAMPLAGREVRCPRRGLEGERVLGHVHEGLPVGRHRLVVAPLGEEDVAPSQAEEAGLLPDQHADGARRTEQRRRPLELAAAVVREGE